MEAAGDPPDLEALDWRQGSLLPPATQISPTLWVHDDVQLDPTAHRAAAGKTAPFRHERSLKAKDRFVVITQSCDVIKPSANLPQIEVARAFTTTDQQTLGQARNFGSARYYLMNPDSDLDPWILDYGWRTFIDKGFLIACEPDNLLVDAWSHDQEASFTRWLGRRNGRPALPDLDVAEICDPVRHRFEQLADEEPEAAARYSGEFAEFRYRREPDGTVSIFLLSPDETPDEILALEVMDLLYEALVDIPGVRLVSDKLSYSTFTKTDELSSDQIDLYWASHEEGEPSGALPPD